MTNKKREEINKWLSERKAIYERYAEELDAELDPFKRVWVVMEDGEKKPLVDSKAVNTEAGLGLLVNHGYYLGAIDALVGWKVL